MGTKILWYSRPEGGREGSMHRALLLTALVLAMLRPSVGWADQPASHPSFAAPTPPAAAALPSSGEPERASSSYLSLGTDLSPWFLEGFSAIAGFEPAGAPRWRVSVELWRMRLPSFAVNLASANRDKGFAHTIMFASAVYVDRELGDSGLHAGAVFNTMSARIERAGDTQTIPIVEALGRVGYRFLPMGPSGLYLDPWLGAGPQVPLARLPTLAGERYALFPVQFIGTLHAGWRF
jgi:hypothetical protein